MQDWRDYLVGCSEEEAILSGKTFFACATLGPAAGQNAFVFFQLSSENVWG